MVLLFYCLSVCNHRRADGIDLRVTEKARRHIYKYYQYIVSVYFFIRGRVSESSLPCHTATSPPRHPATPRRLATTPPRHPASPRRAAKLRRQAAPPSRAAKPRRRLTADSPPTRRAPPDLCEYK